MLKNGFPIAACAWIITIVLPVSATAQTTISAIPEVNRAAQQALISITHSEGNGQWYIYYRTDRQKDFQVRKMNTATSGKATYPLPTGMLYGRNVEYFIVKKTAGTSSKTPVYTVVDANTDPLPEIYFKDNPPAAGADDPVHPAADPLIRLSGSMSRADRLYQKAEDESAAQSSNGNLRIFRNISNEKYQFDFDSSFSFLSPTQAEASAFNLASMMVRFKKGSHQIAIGDLAISQSEYTAPALNRRGLQYELSGHGLYFSAFLANSQQKNGFEGFGIPPAAANIMGAVLGTDVGSILKIRGLVLSGHDDLSLGKTLAYEENPFRAGSIFSLWSDLNLLQNHLQLTGEYARSSFGISALNAADISQKKDNAWRSGLSFNYGIISASATYRRIGENFNSIGNLFMANDRGGLDGNLGLTFKTLTLAVSYADQKNFLKTLSQDGQHQKRLSANIGWQLGSRWRIGSDFSLDNLEYNSKTAMPSTTPGMETLNFNETLGYTSENSSFSLAIGKVKSGEYTSTFSGQLACSLRFGQAMSLAPVFSFQSIVDLTGSGNSDIYSVSVTSEITCVPQWFTCTTSGSYTRNVNDAFTSTAITIDANLNLFLAMLFKNKIQPMLTAKGEIRSNQIDRLTTTAVSLWLQFSLSF